jgi:hypothetical protein
VSALLFIRYLALVVSLAVSAIDGGYGWLSGRRSPRRIAVDALACVAAIVALVLLARGVL